MAGSVYAIPFGTDFIAEVIRFMDKQGVDPERTAVVFPGKRPALYLRKALSKEQNGPFYPPVVFSMEGFMDYTARKAFPDFADLGYPDALWHLYDTLHKSEAFEGHPLKERGFGDFFYWGRYVLEFINHLDIEDVATVALRSVERNAEIGYDVPPHINRLLVHIGLLREEYHATLLDKGCFTRGFKYLQAKRSVAETPFDEFDRIYFAGLFGLTATEREVTGALWRRGTGEIIFEGAPEEWGALSTFIQWLGAGVEVLETSAPAGGSLSVHSGFDVHSQVLKVLPVLTEQKGTKTAVVLPRSESLFPLLSFVIDRIPAQYNISLGYPVSRTAVFELVAAILNLQSAQRAGGAYPASSYLALMLNPFVKNLVFDRETRPSILAVENLLTGREHDSLLADKPYITLTEVEEELRRSRGDDSATLMERVHGLFCRTFQNVATAEGLCRRLEETLLAVLHHTPVRSYVLSGEIFKKTFELLEDLATSQVGALRFHHRDEENHRQVCDFVLHHLGAAAIPFETKPIEEVEIIGLLESRTIRFDRVIILDLNEGVLPGDFDIDPLVPMGVYGLLGIPLPEEAEEAYRYNFYRLIRSARDVHLFYIDSPERPRSRYIEQLLWEREKSEGRLNVVEVERFLPKISLKHRDEGREIPKTDRVMRALAAKVYSPSQLDTFIRCPLAFYYLHILGLEPRRIRTRDMEPTERGTMIHSILHRTLSPFRKRPISPALVDQIITSLRGSVEEVFRGRIITGEHYLFMNLASHKLEAFLRKDIGSRREPFILTHLEERVEGSLDTDRGPVRLKGILDRVDCHGEPGTFTIVDYKTGGTRQYREGIVKKANPGSLADIHAFVPTLQLPLYLHLFGTREALPLSRLRARIALLGSNDEERLWGEKKPEGEVAIMSFYLDAARTVLNNLLDPSAAFRPFDEKGCGTCDVKGLCHR